MRKNAQAKTAATKRTYMQTERRMMDKMSGMKDKMESEQTVHNDMVDFLTRKHVELTKLSNEWEDKYTNDVESKDKELERLTSNQARDREILDGLQERWNQLEDCPWFDELKSLSFEKQSVKPWHQIIRDKQPDWRQ